MVERYLGYFRATTIGLGFAALMLGIPQKGQPQEAWETYATMFGLLLIAGGGGVGFGGMMIGSLFPRNLSLTFMVLAGIGGAAAILVSGTPHHYQWAAAVFVFMIGNVIGLAFTPYPDIET